MGRLSSIFCYGKTDGENPKSETFRGEDPLPKSAASPGRGSVAGHKVNSPRQGRRDLAPRFFAETSPGGQRPGRETDKDVGFTSRQPANAGSRVDRLGSCQG